MNKLSFIVAGIAAFFVAATATAQIDYTKAYQSFPDAEDVVKQTSKLSVARQPPLVVLLVSKLLVAVPTAQTSLPAWLFGSVTGTTNSVLVMITT